MSEMEHGMCISIEPLTDLSATILVPHNNNGSDLSSDDFTGSLHQIATSFFTTWILIVIYSSMIPKNPLSFLSISRSYNELVSQRDSPLKILDFLRVLAIVWVIANHTGSEGRIDILDRAPSAEGFKRAIHDHPVFGALLGNSALGVEIFLVLSGLLAACSWHRHPSSPFSSHYKKFILRRVVRLAPSVIIFIIFASGPVMNDILPRFHDSMISTCGVKGIASHLLFMGNLQETPTCMGYLWYLGLDMQLYLAAPLLLYVLHHRIRLGVVLSILIISLSCLLRALYCTTYGVCNKSDVDIPFISYPDIDPSTLTSIYEGLWEMYSRPHTKCGPFILGLLLGSLYSYWPNTRLSPRNTKLMSHGATVFAVGIIYAILPEYWYPDAGNTTYNTVYTATFRTLFALCICAIIMSYVFTLSR
ncbi:hypothetical protein WR25_04356 isoform A [Diploscapter pachys]|uniref:Acyltransferase 3 domain-containing protein n=1 Tax=Diploscapter pachys TaxID=2018661 RepID=A0A2A2LYM6_9BILA|nr:hypothetical protein WR25_04356 isoform A [Diploscapter pachys]